MSIQGELDILIKRKNNSFLVNINSTRPTKLTQLFVGKTIEQCVSLLPLLFNLCAKAQTITTIKAIESRLNIQIPYEVAKQREIIISLERLREYSLPIFMQWPNYLQSSINNDALNHLVQALNQLMNSFEFNSILYVNPNKKHFNIKPLSTNQQKCWQHCKQLFEHYIFATTVEKWLNYTPNLLLEWAKKKQNQAASFMDWLGIQPWKTAGKSTIKCLPKSLNDYELINLMQNHNINFTAKPQWQNQCIEVSSFSYINNKQTAALTKQFANSLYTRMWIKLINIAQTIKKLNEFFSEQNDNYFPIPPTIPGLAHSFTARGRLTHYIELNENKVHRLLILAPTEWNFHPEGVAADSLKQLYKSNERELGTQAKLVIQSIDPCVGFNIRIDK